MMDRLLQFTKIDRLLQFAVQVCLVSITLGFSNTAQPLLRLVSVAVALLLAAAQCLTREPDGIRSQYVSALCCTSLLLFLHHLDLSLLSPVQHQSRRMRRESDSAQHVKASELVQRVKRGFGRAISFRHIGTPTQVKNVPSFSNENPSFSPSRHRFMLWSMLRMSICYLVLDAMDSVAPSPDETRRLFPPQSIRLITRPENLSLEKLQLRLGATVGFWITLYCVATLTYQVTAVVAVGSMLSSPESWRPLFDSISEASSIRSFWG